MASEPQPKKARLHDGSASSSTSVRSQLLHAAHAPTVKAIVSDHLTAISLEHWAAAKVTWAKFDSALVDKIYQDELSGDATQRVMLLELSKYFENYLWPNFDASKATFAHVMSLVMMLNEKAREGLDPWALVKEPEGAFAFFFTRVLSLCVADSPSLSERAHLIQFLVYAFQGLGDDLVRQQCLPLVHLTSWQFMSEERREGAFKEHPKLKKLWQHLNKEKEKDKKRKKEGDEDLQASFLPKVVQQFLKILNGSPQSEEEIRRVLNFSELFITWMTDLVTQIGTRRFSRLLLEDIGVLVHAKQSPLLKTPKGRVLSQLIERLEYYMRFEMDDFTGDALTSEEVLQRHSQRVSELQRVAYRSFYGPLSELALSNVAAVDTEEKLRLHLNALNDDQLRQLCTLVHLPARDDRELMLATLVHEYTRTTSQLDAINAQPLYPNEALLWDHDQIPDENSEVSNALALPKLNMQFLTFHDYFLRNYTLFRLESAYEIRSNLEDVLRRLQPHATRHGDDSVHIGFNGWSKNAIILDTPLKIMHISPPRVGTTLPSEVRASLTYSLPPSTRGGDSRSEWDQLREHDIVFLVTVSPPIVPPDASASFTERLGITHVRGAEVLALKDGEGNFLSDPNPHTKPREGKGNKRVLTLLMDPAQYHLDDPSIYGNFNVLIRRKAKENNFKAVLETLRELMNERLKVPQWLQDVLLGYASDASPKIPRVLNMEDTFCSREHLINSFPNRTVEFLNEIKDDATVSYRLDIGESEKDPIRVTPYQRLPTGPYPRNLPRKNSVPFTPTQVNAVMRAMGEGINLVIGPPGTGKTDVAVQIISNWYHHYPEQRTLLITHSNQALNALFEKIAALDIDPRHLLRLGHGEAYLDVEEDFSKFGRVNFMLKRRLELLEKAEKVAVALGLSPDLAVTCETAGNLYTYHVLARWEQFQLSLKKASDKGDAEVGRVLREEFPFRKVFPDLLPLFTGDLLHDRERTSRCWAYVSEIFQELQECRAFELLKSWSDRGDYLLMRQAKIIALTCTHAALKRRELLELGFKYDNVIVEEAAQILEIEAFVPLTLQRTDPEAPPRLKRVVLIGDHHQLPPIVQNLAIARLGHLDQSLFARLARLNVSQVLLDRQGRARPSLSALYSWRYPKALGDLPHVFQGEYTKANPGFLFDYQLINVEDFQGRGESAPNPFFYQNLGEAEYVVAVYMFMRMLGYPKEKIAILTTYNGQKHLIRDVVEARCAKNPAFGRPSKITTVDRYQGQQNDYVLLSLVRTSTVGHLRDVRRLVVAMSRSRLGLYVFCRRRLFENCYELTPTFAKLLERPDKLVLVQEERYGATERPLNADLGRVRALEVRDVMHMGQIVGTV